MQWVQPAVESWDGVMGLEAEDKRKVWPFAEGQWEVVEKGQKYLSEIIHRSRKQDLLNSGSFGNKQESAQLRAQEVQASSLPFLQSQL